MALLILLVTLLVPGLGFAQTFEAPVYKVGDEWRYSGGVVTRVVAFEPGQVTFLVAGVPNCPECQYTWSSDRALLRVVDKAGKPVDDTRVGLKTMQFPMSVGVEWTANQTLRQRNTPDLMPYDNTFKVVSYADVKTKAGVFKAFKITWEQENKGTYRHWKGRLIRWYSPDVKNWVKQEVLTEKWLSDFELESYSLK
jgi:hypothetical protein